ncbi:MAG: hypothetical protein HOJ67_10625 [Rhodospirillaceae bacterium]|nr:hypothetical protein [Rhodospirillaceae bacterium]
MRSRLFIALIPFVFPARADVTGKPRVVDGDTRAPVNMTNIPIKPTTMRGTRTVFTVYQPSSFLVSVQTSL